MSLKGVHVFFIVSAAFLAFSLAAWAYGGKRPGIFWLSLLAGAALAAYLAWFIRKIKRIGPP